MNDINSAISGLSRPRLLVNAARYGLSAYRRNRQLPRILGQSGTIKPDAAAVQLISIEAEMNEKRRTQATDYSVAKHIDVLSALMAEAHLVAEGKPT